jgi:serine phosphatase RsbU (regulator of sigma subunit)
MEAYGRTILSQSVGGDLVDLVAADGRVLAYLADVSGHGIPAGLLMGIVKTAVRQGVLFGQPLPALLDSV